MFLQLLSFSQLPYSLFSKERLPIKHLKSYFGALPHSVKKPEANKRTKPPPTKQTTLSKDNEDRVKQRKRLWLKSLRLIFFRTEKVLPEIYVNTFI